MANQEAVRQPSPERQFAGNRYDLNDLYQRFYGVTYDSGNYAFPPSLNYLRDLAAGSTYTEVEDKFARDPRFLRRIGAMARQDPNKAVSLFYQNILKRQSDPTGEAIYVDQIRSGRPIREIALELSSSAEYSETMVRRLYEEVLERPADEGGLQYYSGFLKQGHNLSEVAGSMKDSPEYQDIPNKNPQKITFNKLPIGQVLSEMEDARGSDEFSPEDPELDEQTRNLTEQLTAEKRLRETAEHSLQQFQDGVGSLVEANRRLTEQATGHIQTNTAQQAEIGRLKAGQSAQLQEIQTLRTALQTARDEAKTTTGRLSAEQAAEYTRQLVIRDAQIQRLQAELAATEARLQEKIKNSFTAEQANRLKDIVSAAREQVAAKDRNLQLANLQIELLKRQLRIVTRGDSTPVDFILAAIGMNRDSFDELTDDQKRTLLRALNTFASVLHPDKGIFQDDLPLKDLNGSLDELKRGI